MKDTTNNIMELTAVIESLKYVLDILKKEKNYNILLNNVKNVELWKTLYSLKKQIEELPSVNLIFNKVKGHNRR